MVPAEINKASLFDLDTPVKVRDLDFIVAVILI